MARPLSFATVSVVVLISLSVPPVSRPAVAQGGGCTFVGGDCPPNNCKTYNDASGDAVLEWMCNGVDEVDTSVCDCWSVEY